MKELREYQSKILEDIREDVIDKVENIVMAMCPNAGKTFTTIKLIERLLSEGHVKKVLVLAHGTTVLRDQFYTSMVENKPSFTISSVTPESKDVSGQVIVAIPQGLVGVDLTEFDFLVVDEAHERFLAKQGQELAKKVNAKSNLLLTGTPSKFIYQNIKKEKYKMHMVAMSDIDSEFMANSQIFICSSKYTFKDSDYTETEELRYDTKFKKSETEGSLDELVKQLVKTLKMKKIINLDNLYPLAFSKLQKTMIVCRRQNQAKQVLSHLKKKGIESTISTEDVDKNSENITKFIEDDSIKVLIVVGRGILGFNLPTLVNVVDMSGTRNLDRMYQMFSRITRTHKDHPVKRYFKLAPVGEVEYTQYVASAMLSLIHRDNMKMYNGKNFKIDLPILVKKETKEKNEEGKYSEKSGSKKSSQSIMEFEGLDVIVEFKRMYSNMDKTLQVYSRINLQEAMVALNKYSKQLPANWWNNKERVIEASRDESYKNVSDFTKGNGSAYNAALKNGWLQELVEINKWNYTPRGHWNIKANVVKVSKNYENLSDFTKGDAGAYDAARKNGWMQELVELNKWNYTPRGHWDIKANVTEASKEYKNLSDFIKGNVSAYDAARKNGWMQELVELNGWEDRTIYKKKVQCIETGKIFESINKTAGEMKLPSCSIGRICNGKQKQTGGYTFKYVEEDE